MKERKRISLRGWPMRAVAAAAIIVLLALTVMPQNAEADGFWERLSRWTESIFEFFTPGGKTADTVYVFETDNPGLQQVYDAVTDLGVTDPVVPMWLPEGYVLETIEVLPVPEKTLIYSRFALETEYFTYQMHIYDSVYSHKFQKDNTTTKVLELDGTKYYILRNNDMWSVVWVKENIECSIFAACQEETLHQILASI